jgi:hypothetical protein
MPVSQFEKYVVEIMPAISKSCMNVSVCLAYVVENLKIDKGSNLKISFEL